MKKKLLILGIILLVLIIAVVITLIVNKNTKNNNMFDIVSQDNFSDKIISYVEAANKYGNDNIKQLERHDEIRVSVGNLLAYDYVKPQKIDSNGFEVINNPFNGEFVNDVVFSITLKNGKLFTCIESDEYNKALLDDANGKKFADYYC